MELVGIEESLRKANLLRNLFSGYPTEILKKVICIYIERGDYLFATVALEVLVVREWS